MNKEPLKKYYTFEELHLFNTEDWKAIPECGGIYKVYKPDGFEMKFRVDSDAPDTDRYKRYDVGELEEKWERIENCKNKYEEGLLYVGKAKNLRRRIGQYVRTGYGIDARHSGGRSIFQLENNKQLMIKIFKCDNFDECESEELDNYKIHRDDMLPFANRILGKRKIGRGKNEC